VPPTRGVVVVVGLGPAGADLLVPAARDALEQHTVRLARTARHPAVQDLADAGIEFEALDDRYEGAVTFDDCYRSIVDAVVDAASEHGAVVYAVPGSPAVAERTVELLRDAANTGAIELRVVPGLSFAELAWGHLGVDPLTTGAHVVDGRALHASAIDRGLPLLVAQCDDALVLSDVKLALLERLDPTTTVTVLQRLGLPEERVEVVALEDLDRVVTPDHLTSVYVSAAPRSTPPPLVELARLLALAERLRGPGGCPWDAEQTHHSLTRYLLEESYEVVEAVEDLPADAPRGIAADDPRYGALVDELGDLLYQVIFHAVLADEAGAFDMSDVARVIHDKLVRRHPHVFADADADTSAAVMANWEQIKKEEKGAASIVAGITPGLPSLLYAHKLLRKAASVGLDPGDVDESLLRVDAAVASLRSPEGADEDTALGELLAASVALARSLGVDAESALRGWSARFRSRFERVEQLAADRAVDLHALAPDDVRALWNEVA
jgi:tetrapyrrole methylase family protein / MazG family protein